MLIQSNYFMSFSCQKSLPFDQWKSILRCMTAFFIFSTRAPYSEYNCSERRWDFRVPHLMVLCFAFPEISQPRARGRENGLNLHWQALLVDFYLFFFAWNWEWPSGLIFVLAAFHTVKQLKSRLAELWVQDGRTPWAVRVCSAQGPTAAWRLSAGWQRSPQFCVVIKQTGRGVLGRKIWEMQNCDYRCSDCEHLVRFFAEVESVV